MIPKHWIENTENPSCKRCGNKEFTDIGECNVCGEFLLIMPKEIIQQRKRKIFAAEKWAKIGIPKNVSQRCAVCGVSLEPIIQISDNVIGIMVAMMIRQKPEYNDAAIILGRVYPERTIKDYEIVSIAKNIIDKSNLIFPVENVTNIYQEIIKFLGNGNYSICMNCLLEDTKKEELKSTNTNLGIKMELKMPPKLIQDQPRDPNWGEETLEFEEFDDDPKEIIMETINTKNQDDWDEVPIKTQANTTVTLAKEIDWDDDEDDDWDENAVEVIR
jgi:hypothetical protein